MLYQLPIGTLTTEALVAEEDQNVMKPGELRKKLQVTFEFQPPSCLMYCLLQTNYAIYMKGNILPHGKRTQSGAMSLLPAELKSCLDEGDCLAAADCFSGISLRDVMRLCESKHLNGVLVPSHLVIVKDAKGRSIIVRSCSMTLDARTGTSDPHPRYVMLHRLGAFFMGIARNKQIPYLGTE